MKQDIEEVGRWALDKHRCLCRYIDISRYARGKFLQGAGATYIDLFCGAGRARVRETNEIIDGSAIVAWKQSVKGKFPFSKVYIADIDADKRRLCAEYLRSLGAPVVELDGDAVTAATALMQILNSEALHFAFLDPYSLSALDFRIIKTLASFKRMDMLIHISAMDMQRNVPHNLSGEQESFDAFAPGWRDCMDRFASQHEVRRQLLEYWRSLVAAAGSWPSTEIKLITGEKNQRLYWLLLAARHDLAHKFWKIAANDDPQRRFDF